MSGEQFLEKYKNRNWISLFDNPDVRRFVLSYPNETSRVSIINAIYSLVRMAGPDFDISSFLDMDAISAREKTWAVVMSYIEKGKYRIGGMVKVYAKSLYDYVHELRRDNQVIVWRKRHQVPNIKSRKTEVPDHQQIYRLVDTTTHLKIQAIVLLSYSSGLKGAGLINLQVGHLREAIKFREKLKNDFIDERKKTNDPRTQKDLDELITDLPLIIRITPQIYFKRFRNSGSKDWYPALICRDAEEIIMRYYDKKRSNASDSEPLFVTRNNRKFSQVQLSKLLKYNVKKFFMGTGELKHTSPSHLRRSFYNRLIAGNMKDIHREYLMGHALGVKGHYFDWESNKKEILISYIQCNFNRVDNGITREITTLKQDSMSKDEKIKRLEEELQYFKSPQFTENLVLEVNKFTETHKDEPVKVLTKVIKIGDAESWKKLTKEGYYLVSSDDEHFVMQKELDE